jgi:hypothetical protein
MLLNVVREGTATKADLATFDVAGKSGTARRTSANEGYTAGNYTASFVGLFPGNDPQYVVLVKLDSPKGAHYAGGDIAAPVTKMVLRAALAANDAALDRENLAESEKVSPAQSASQASDRLVSAPDRKLAKAVERGPERPNAESYDPNRNLARRDGNEGAASFVVELPAVSKIAPVAVSPRAIPDVRGMPIREAVRVLHAAGFRVRLLSTSGTGTLPSAGTITAPGTVVQLSRPVE